MITIANSLCSYLCSQINSLILLKNPLLLRRNQLFKNFLVQEIVTYMPQLKLVLIAGLMLISTIGACQSGSKDSSTKKMKASVKYKIEKSDEEWRKELTKEEFQVLRQKGTERAFTGEFDRHKEEGVYTCAACGQELFSSEAKFDSGSGWPSYFKPLSKEAVHEITDRSHGMLRTEVVCNNCGGHLGHVFNDGPRPTGLRYCINSVSLDFVKKDQ